MRFDPIISENFNGGEVYSVEPILLKTNELQKAINVRFQLGGGFQPRPGFEEKTMTNFTGVGTNGPQGMFANGDNEVYIAINGKIFVTNSDFTDAFELYSGLSNSAKVEFLEVDGNIYVMNGVDVPLRMMRTTTATALDAGVSTTLDVKTGQGFRFGTSGTVRVISPLGYDDITYSARTNDALTITAGTVDYSHPIGSLIYEVKTITGAYKVAFGTEFQNVWFAAGNQGESTKTFSGNTLFWTVGATGLNPEKFYDFTGSGSGFIPAGDKSDIVGLLKTKTYMLIFKNKSILYCSGFNSSNIPIIEPLTEIYGAAGPRAFTQVGDQVIVFTGRAIKQVGEQENLTSAIPSVNAQFDDKIFKWFQELDEDQSDAVLHYNPDKKLLKLWCNVGGARICRVLDTNIAEQPWSRDTNKNASCAVFFKGETFWGSDSEAKIFQDEVGYDDNGIGIRTEVKLADFNAGSTRISKYFQYQYLRGLLGESAIVTVKIYFDDELIQQYELTDDLITVSGGTPIGRELVGGGIATSDANAALGYPFEIEKLLKKRRDTSKMTVEFISDGTGQVFEIKGQEINGFYSKKFDRKIRS